MLYQTIIYKTDQGFGESANCAVADSARLEMTADKLHLRALTYGMGSNFKLCSLDGGAEHAIRITTVNLSTAKRSIIATAH